MSLKTNNHLEEYTKYIDILEKKINKISEVEETSNIVKKLNVQGIQSLKKEDYAESLKIFRKIVGLIKSINQS